MMNKKVIWQYPIHKYDPIFKIFDDGTVDYCSHLSIKQMKAVIQELSFNYKMVKESCEFNRTK